MKTQGGQERRKQALKVREGWMGQIPMYVGRSRMGRKDRQGGRTKLEIEGVGGASLNSLVAGKDVSGTRS